MSKGKGPVRLQDLYTESRGSSLHSLGPSGLSLCFFLHISFILLSFQTFHHLACLWSSFGHLSTAFHNWTPISSPQEEGTDWPSVGQVSTSGPTGCCEGGHSGGETSKAAGALGVGRSSPGWKGCPLCRQPPYFIGEPEALRSNHAAHGEPRTEPLRQADLGLTIVPTG